MNKTDLIERVAGECGLSKLNAGRVVNSVLSIISEALASDDRVKLVGFGTFSVTQRPPRNVRVPQTGAMMQLPARKAIRFKAGTKFVETIRAIV